MFFKFINYIKNKNIESQGLKDYKRLVAKYPDLGKSSSLLAEAAELLKIPYQYYKENVSSGGSAISLELAEVLFALAKLKQARRILDLGSGFSSYVFRLYQAQYGPSEVWSVDSDPFWLERTKDFLTEKNLNTENLFTWDQFLQKDKPKFDLILVDIRPVANRVNNFDLFMDILSDKGFLVYDDCHKQHLYKPLSKKIGLNKNSIMYNLHKLTFDSYERFSILIEGKN